jgi:hypothetical protein
MLNLIEISPNLSKLCLIREIICDMNFFQKNLFSKLLFLNTIYRRYKKKRHSFDKLGLILIKLSILNIGWIHEYFDFLG